MRRALFVLSCGLTLAFAATAGDARANGRFPASNQLFFTDVDPNLVFLRVTFGDFVSHDRGVTWSWVCEPSIHSAGVEDVEYALTPSGNIVGSTFNGVTVSTDHACSWSLYGPPLKGLVFVDLTQSTADRKDVVAMASAFDHEDDAGDALFKTLLFETTDEGATFAPLGAALDPTVLAETIDFAPSDPSRVYVSATRNPGNGPTGILFTSTNHGVDFTPHAIALVNDETSLFIAGVDPVKPDRVYLRSNVNDPMSPTRLILWDEAAATATPIFTAKAGLAGFALSPDGGKIYIGSTADGLQVASTSDFAFTQRSTTQIQCLSLQSDGLWACSNEVSGFIAALSHDDGATFETKLHFCDVAGPLECPADSTTNTLCTPLWPPQRANLGCGPATSGDAGSSGGVPPADAGAGPGAAPSDGSGCATASHEGGDGAPSWPLLALAGLAAVLARALTRRRR